MTKKEIVKRIAKAADIPQGEVLKIVQMLFDGITDILVDEGSIELRNFGVFKVKQRKARIARNPRTGEVVKVRAQKTVTFKAGKDLLTRIGKSAAPSSVPA